MCTEPSRDVLTAIASSDLSCESTSVNPALIYGPILGVTGVVVLLLLWCMLARRNKYLRVLTTQEPEQIHGPNGSYGTLNPSSASAASTYQHPPASRAVAAPAISNRNSEAMISNGSGKRSGGGGGSGDGGGGSSTSLQARGLAATPISPSISMDRGSLNNVLDGYSAVLDNNGPSRSQSRVSDESRVNFVRSPQESDSLLPLT